MICERSAKKEKRNISSGAWPPALPVCPWLFLPFYTRCSSPDVHRLILASLPNLIRPWGNSGSVMFMVTSLTTGPPPLNICKVFDKCLLNERIKGNTYIFTCLFLFMYVSPSEFVCTTWVQKLLEAWRGHQILWDCSHRLFELPWEYKELNLGLPEEQPGLLTSVPLLQAPVFLLFIGLTIHMTLMSVIKALCFDNC